MILLWGVPSESPMTLVAEAAERLEVPYTVLSQREAGHAGLRFSFDGGSLQGELEIRGRRLDFAEIDGLYLRCMEPSLLPENRQLAGAGMDETGARARSLMFHASLFELVELLPWRVMNRTAAMASNLSKPYQMQRIAESGLPVPETLVTNSPEAARSFHDSQRRLIFKSISSVRSIVQELTGPRLGQLDRIRALPVQFQQLLTGSEIRVHVAGDEIFAAAINSPALDYRYAGRDGQEVEMQACELPGPIRQRCFQLSRALQLPLCGIDLKRTADGSHYCFEVNPSPGYSYFQENTGQDIAGGIVRYLAGLQTPFLKSEATLSENSA